MVFISFVVCIFTLSSVTKEDFNTLLTHFWSLGSHVCHFDLLNLTQDFLYMILPCQGKCYPLFVFFFFSLKLQALVLPY